MEEQKLKGDNATDNLTDLWDEKSDFLNDDGDDSLPELDRWNDELKDLLSDEERPPEHQTVSPEPVVELKAVETKLKEPVTEEKIIEPPRKIGHTITDKQLFLLVKKYKQANIICDVTGMTLQTLRNRVGHLCYKLKKYIAVEGLYRDTDPVEFKSDGIRVTTAHLVETDFKLGDRFMVGFKDKYIILARLPKSSNT
jgi:hypothetical protein